MKAGVVYGPRNIGVGEFEMPVPETGQVLIQVKAAGICGSDLHYHRSDAPGSQEGRIMGGHELSGQITAVGNGVKKRKVGERIGVEPLLGCGECQFCSIGDYHLCKNLTHPGGGFREYTVISEEKAFPLPDHVSFEDAALLDCLAVGVHAIHRANLKITDNVAVIGDGAIGLSTVQMARAAGARRVAIIGHHERNMNIARKVGADIAIDSSKSDAAEEIIEFTSGQGCHAVFETVGGVTNTIESAIKMARPRGRIVVIGSFARSVELSFRHLLRNEIDLIYSWSYATWDGVPEFVIALDLLARKKLDAASLITHRFPIDKISEAFDAALNKDKSGALKVLITYK